MTFRMNYRTTEKASQQLKRQSTECLKQKTIIQIA